MTSDQIYGRNKALSLRDNGGNYPSCCVIVAPSTDTSSQMYLGIKSDVSPLNIQISQEEYHATTHLTHERLHINLIYLNHMQGSVIPVVLDLTANHQGWFTFKICPNNDIWYQSISIWANPNAIAGKTQNNLALTCSLSLWAKIGLQGIQSLTIGLVFGSSMSICHGGRIPFWNFSIDKIWCYCTWTISVYFTIFLGILCQQYWSPFLRMLFLQVILFPMHPAVDLHSW